MCTALVEIYQENYCTEQGTTHHIEHAGAATRRNNKENCHSLHAGNFQQYVMKIISFHSD